jgi:putative ABC transport system substrate-binding protein
VRRRDFLALMAAGLALPARAQTAARRVAWISPGRDDEGKDFLDALRLGLRERGYVQGRNLVLEPHCGNESGQRVADIARQLVASPPDVIVTQGASALALQRANATTPVVFGYSGDPVEAGLVATLARPGGNFTGITFLTLELVGKRVEQLSELLPRAKRIAVIANPQHAGDKAERRVSEHAAAARGLTLEYFEARNSEQLLAALAAVEKSRSDAVMLFPVQFVIGNRERIAAWAQRTRIPAISGWAQFADGGNVMTYGPNLVATFRRLASYVDRIFKGARPGELAVELPAAFELVLNLKAAKGLGIAIPQSLRLRADRVIE